jgi:FKBP-type peptidyl-prolyl cis-trans isomerase 2
VGIKEGNRVNLRYLAKFEDGKVFDEGYFEFEVGAVEIITGVEEGVLGMEEGERKELTVPPKKGYGERKEGLKKTFPKLYFRGRKFKKGNTMRFQTKTGKIVQCLVDEVTKDEVTFDFNNPLAGKTLKFELEVIEVN